MKHLEDRSEMNSRLQQHPIAIVGMASIFANSRNLEQYWENITTKLDAIMDVPLSRWNIDDHYSPDKKSPDKTYCRRGGFIPDIDFDPMEFGLPPNILEVTDVAQLMALVVARDVLDDAGIGESSGYDRDKVGIVLGVGGGQQQIVPLSARLQGPVLEKVLASCGIDEADRGHIIEKFKKAYVGWEENSFPGMLGNVIAGRVANRFDFGGTNCVVDAACAGSLAAMKLAISDLLEFRSEVMISGGICCDNSPFMYMSFSKTPAFTTNENVRSFDENSKGMMVGEGIGMVALKRLADAERDGDKIYAVIHGIGSSSDGRFKSIYAPRPDGQAKALMRAYSDAGFDPASVGLIEAHGTGTIAGDAAEFEGLTKFFGADNKKTQHIGLGTVKSQIGHTKAAAGTAGIIKAALALHHKVLPATINVTRPNAQLKIENSPFYLNTETRPWIPRVDGVPRRAGVSSFGFGGSNFHFVLQEYSPKPSGSYRLNEVPQSILLSAPDVSSLKSLASNWISKLAVAEAEQPFVFNQLVLEAPAATPALQNARIGFLAQNGAEALVQLSLASKTWASQPEALNWALSGVYFRATGVATHGKVAAVFSGQGSQFVDMGIEAVCNFPPLMDATAAMDREFSHNGLPALSTITYPVPVFSSDEALKNEQRLQQTQYAQPAIGAVSMGLYETFRQAGLAPDFAAGHSFGEWTALWAAGVLSDDDYRHVANARGQAMASQPRPGFDPGTMFAVVGKTEEVAQHLERFEGVVIANDNSATQVVIAGPTSQVEAATQALKTHGFQVVPLPVSAAFHTPLVGHAQLPLAEVIDKVAFRVPQLPVYSNLSGELHSKKPELIKQAMKRHMVEPVRFRQEIEALYKAGARVFVEFGPKNVLAKLLEGLLGNKGDVLVVATGASPKKSSDRQLRLAAIELAVYGVELKPVDPYSAVLRPTQGRKKSPTSIKLNAAPYVSPKTREAFESALTDGYRLKSTSPVVNVSPPVAPVQQVVPDQQFVPSPSFLEESVTQLLETQNRLLAIHEQFLKGPEEYSRVVQNVMASQASGVSAPEALGRSLAMYHEFQLETMRLHEQFLASQGNAFGVASGAVGTPRVSSPKTPALPLGAPQVAVKAPLPAPVPEAPVAQAEARPVAVVVAPVAHAVAGPDLQAVKATMMKVVADKTGYPSEMLELSMDMEADLGIDSIKRVEILGAVQEAIPGLPELNPADLAELRTLGQIVDYMNAQSGAPQASPKQNHVVPSYTVIARRLSTPTVRPSTAKGHILVVDDGVLGVSLSARLLAEGEKITLVRPTWLASTSADSPSGVTELELSEVTDASVKNLISHSGPVSGVLYLQARAEAQTLSFSGGSKRGVLLAFLLAKYCSVKTSTSGRPSFLAVTAQDGRFGWASPSSDAVQGGLSGLIKTLSHEWPGVFCRTVDLSPGLDQATTVDLVIDEYRDAEMGVTEVGHDLQGRWTLSAEPVDGTDLGSGAPITSKEVFLVSGGAKGVTAHCVVRLAEEYHCGFILLGRSALAPEPAWAKGKYTDQDLKSAALQHLSEAGEKPTPVKIQEALRPIHSSREIAASLAAIEGAGGRAVYVSCDVTRSKEVRSAVASAAAVFGKVTGLIHGAGVLADRLIEQKTVGDFEAVYSTKVDGLEALLSAVDAKAIKHYVLFSSAAAYFGNPGQADYAIANEILNKVALRLKSEAPAAQVLSLNWGPWDGGMVTPELKRLFEARGATIIPLDGGADLLLRELSASTNRCTQILVGGNLNGPDEKKKPRPERLSKRLPDESNSLLRDHVLGASSVLPTVCAMAWMADAVETAYPGWAYQGVENYQLLKGIVFDGSQLEFYQLELQPEEEIDGVLRVAVSVVGQSPEQKSVRHYKAVVLASQKAVVLGSTTLDLSKADGREAKVFYANRTLFHGPSLHGLKSLLSCGPSGLLFSCHVDPSVVENLEFPASIRNVWANDLVYQAMLVWVREQSGSWSLPSSTGSWVVFREVLPGETFYLRLTVKKAEKTKMVADISLVDERFQVLTEVQDAAVTISDSLKDAFAHP